MKFKRTSYQFGCLQPKERKRGPKVWVLRYRKPRPDGTTKLASQMIGTIKQYPTESQAWKAAEVIRLSANPDNPAQYGVSWGALIDRYISEEIPKRKTTKRTYLIFLEKFIRPKWGGYALTDVKPFAVRQWLTDLKRSDGARELAPKTKAHLRGLIHTLYGYALRLGLVPLSTNPFAVNPFGERLIPIDGASKPLKPRRSLTVQEFHRLLRHPLIAEEPFRTMVTAAICLGLRCSELFGLKWSDFDWRGRSISISRRVVRRDFDRPKTSSSEAPVPLAPELANVFRHWKLLTPYNNPDDYVFGSPSTEGRVPYSPEGIQKDRLASAGVDTGFGNGLGWHNFRHTYRSLLDDVGAPLTVQQHLMRHADPRQTLKYGEAYKASKRNANRKVVRWVLTGRKKGAV